MKTYDVAIVGAGPAGAVAAVLCARSGLKTVLVEKKRLPRVKICGGGVTGKSIGLLREIDCFRDESIQRFISSAMIHLPKTGTSYELTSKTPFMGIVDRAGFDMELAETAARAGAEVRQGQRFIQYRRTKPYQLEIKTDTSTFNASILIGADGVHSRVRRQVIQEGSGGSALRPAILGVACDIPLDAPHRLSVDHCHLFFNLIENAGYAWAFPRAEVFNAGLVVYTGRPNPIRLFKTFIKTITTDTPAGLRPQFAPLPRFEARKDPLVQEENVLLVGDAAGFADAWTGEGIYYSIRSAVLAHRVIHAAVVDQKGFKFLSNYASLCKKAFFRELRMSARVAGFFINHPSAYDLLQYPKVRELFLPHTMGEIGYLKAFFKAFIYSLAYRASILKKGDMP